VGGRDHRGWAFVDGVDGLGVVDPSEVDRGDREVGMPELALDDEQRHAFARHLDRVGVAELMGREPASYTGSGGGVVELQADTGGRPRATGGRASKDAEQSADRERGAQLQPWGELLPRPSVHPDFAALAALCCAQNYVAYWVL
jgi:hypothetical protein